MRSQMEIHESGRGVRSGEAAEPLNRTSEGVKRGAGPTDVTGVLRYSRESLERSDSHRIGRGLRSGLDQTGRLGKIGIPLVKPGRQVEEPSLLAVPVGVPDSIHEPPGEDEILRTPPKPDTRPSRHVPSRSDRPRARPPGRAPFSVSMQEGSVRLQGEFSSVSFSSDSCKASGYEAVATPAADRIRFTAFETLPRQQEP